MRGVDFLNAEVFVRACCLRIFNDELLRRHPLACANERQPCIDGIRSQQDHIGQRTHSERLARLRVNRDVRGVDLNHLRRHRCLCLRRVAAAQVAVTGCIVGEENMRGRVGRDTCGERIQSGIWHECASIERRHLDDLVRAECSGVVLQFAQDKQHDLRRRVRKQCCSGKRLASVVVERTAVAVSGHEQ